MLITTCLPSKSTIHQISGNYLNGFKQIQSEKKLDILAAITKIASYILFAGVTYISAYMLWLATKPSLTITATQTNSESPTKTNDGFTTVKYKKRKPPKPQAPVSTEIKSNSDNSDQEANEGYTFEIDPKSRGRKKHAQS